MLDASQCAQQSQNPTYETIDIETHSCSAYEVETKGVSMEANTAYGVSDVEMQTCGAYEAEKKSVFMEDNPAYSTNH